MFRLWPVLLTAAPFVVAAISWVLRPHGFVISIRHLDMAGRMSVPT